MRTLLFIFLIIFTLISCKKKPTMWESDWSLPIINDTLSLNNFVNDSTLGENVSGFYDLNLDRTLFNLGINDILDSIPDTTITENLTISFLNLTMPPGFSYVNSSEEHNLNIPDVELKKIILRNGFLDVEVHNPISTITIFNVLLPGVTKDGLMFSDQFEAPPGTNANRGIVSETIDLAGYELDLTGLSGAEFNRLVAQISVSTDPSGPTVTTTNLDTTKVKATFRGLELDYARGYFGDKIYADTTELFLEEMDIYQSGLMDVTNTSIKFEFENSIKVGGEGKLINVSNENNFGTIVSLSNPQIGVGFNLDPATGSWNNLIPSMNIVEFNSSNSNIEPYLENFGSKHTIGYSFQLNPWGNVSGGWDEIYPTSKIKVKLKANMPLSIGFDNLVLRDTFDVVLNQDPDKTRILEGDIILKASNSFPFSGSFELLFLDENGNVIHTVASLNEVQASQFGTFNTGYNFDVCDSEVKINLPANVVTDINDITQIIVQVKLNSLNATTGISEVMSIPIGAFLAIKLKTKFKTETVF